MLRPSIICRTALLAIAVACEDPETPPLAPPLGDVVVLNGTDPKGLTILAEVGATPSHLAFDPYDGASFNLRNDTAVSTSSKAAGDILFVAQLKTGTIQKIQMPAGSNPAGVQFGPVSDTATRLFVALRDTREVAEVPLPNPAKPIVRHTGAGECPVDVIVTETKVWALDSNQRCTSDYSIVGPSRLVPIPGMGSADTITLLSAVVSAQRAYVVGNYAYVMSAGDYFSIPGAITKVDLISRNSIVVPLNNGFYAMSMRIGKNGYLYVTAAPPISDPPIRVYAINLETMNFGGTREELSQHLHLRKSNGTEPRCFAATADALGNIYCVENGNILSTVLVFNPAGNQIRSVAGGSLGFDIALR